MTDKNKRKSNIIKILIFVAIIVVVFLVIKQLGYMKYFRQPQLLKEAMDGLGFWGPFVFIFLWICSAVFLLPGSALGIVGGILFGPWFGTIYTAIGATLGALFAFIAGKYVARDMVKNMLKSNPKLNKIDEGVKKEGWRFVMLTRLVPIFPYNVQNYVYALTGINIAVYTLTTFIFMLPGCFAFSFAGGAITTGGSPVKIIAYLAVAGVVLFIISLIPKWIKKRRGGDILEDLEEDSE